MAAACSPARSHAPGAFDETITSGGTERTYILHIPARYNGEEALPLVLNLHGFGSNATQQARYSGFPERADEEGFVLITPQGTGGRPFWNAFDIPTLPDDVALMSNLVDVIQQDLCIDGDRVYATGISNGAAMSSRLACDLSDRIAAIGAVAGLSYPRNCATARPIPVIAFHGTADAVVPYEGGPIMAGLSQQLGLQAPPVQETVANWAEHNACANIPLEEQMSGSVSIIAYDGCEEAAAVVFYAIDGGGHTWPGAIDVARLGATTHEISATDLIWEFFVAHPMP
jgi:polyhydroxybutyrate depolymerase